MPRCDLASRLSEHLNIVDSLPGSALALIGMVATLNEAIPVLSLLVVSAAFGAWALVDAIRTPDMAFHAIGRSRTIWVALMVALALLSLFVLFVLAALLAAACYYLVAIRPQLKLHRT